MYKTMILDFVQIYLITFCGAVALPLLLYVARTSGAFITPFLRRQCASMVHLTLTFWPRTSYLQTALLLFYFGVNAVLLSLNIKEKGTREGTLSRRASLLASANTMILFLGGKTNPWVDFVQIPVFVYNLAHRWIAVVSVCEALLHSALELYRRPPAAPAAKSGCVVCESLDCKKTLTRYYRLPALFSSHSSLPYGLAENWASTTARFIWFSRWRGLPDWSGMSYF